MNILEDLNLSHDMVQNQIKICKAYEEYFLFEEERKQEGKLDEDD